MGFGEEKLSPESFSSPSPIPQERSYPPMAVMRHGIVAALKEPRPDGLVSGGEGDDAADGFDAELGMPQGVAEPVFPVVEQACPQRSVGRDAEPVTGRAEMAGKRRDQAEAPEAGPVRA